MITIKSEREIELMRHAGMLVSEMHKFIKPYIKAGVTPKKLGKLINNNIDLLKREGVSIEKRRTGSARTYVASYKEILEDD